MSCRHSALLRHCCYVAVHAGPTFSVGGGRGRGVHRRPSPPVNALKVHPDCNCTDQSASCPLFTRDFSSPLSFFSRFNRLRRRRSPLTAPHCSVAAAAVSSSLLFFVLLCPRPPFTLCFCPDSLPSSVAAAAKPPPAAESRPPKNPPPPPEQGRRARRRIEGGKGKEAPLPPAAVPYNDGGGRASPFG